MRRMLTAILVTTFPAAPVLASEEATPGRDALTIYSSANPGAVNPELYRGGHGTVPGYAVVRHERVLSLEKGHTTVRFADVAERLDPTTVTFESLTDPAGTSVLEQNFQFDLVSQEKLLQRYIDRPITIEQARAQNIESFSGTLLSTQGALILREPDGGVRIVPNQSGVKLPSLPGGLTTRPTLVWDVTAKKAGPHRTRVSYQTGGLTWWADYNITYAERKGAGTCALDVAAWVSIVNQSGASYSDAKLKLVAGDVQRATPPAAALRLEKSVAAAQDAAPGFAEKPFFEFHLYTLGRPTTLPDNSTKQIELFPVAHNVPCEKTLVYYGLPSGSYGFTPNPLTDRNYGSASNRKVDVYLRFRNGAEQKLGMPLPAGRIRVSKLDAADQTREFIGEDAIDHTPKDESVRLKLGSAFDVVGERKQLDFTLDTAHKQMSEEIEVRLRNHKSEPVMVIVKENLYRWINWRIERSTQSYEKEDARTVHFPVKVPPGGETVVRYSVRYSW